MRTWYRPCSILIILLLPLLSSGCWSSIEVQNRAILSSAGVDIAEDPTQISLTMQVINPAVGQESKDSVLITSAVADSVFLATRKARQILSRKPYWGQLQVFVIGEDLAREGIKRVLDFLDRDYEPNRHAWILIAKGTTAQAILLANWGFSGIPAAEKLGLVQMAVLDGRIYVANVNDLIMSLERDGHSTTTGYLELTADSKHPPDQVDKEAKVALAGSAVFCKDRLVGFLDTKLSRGVNWVTDRVSNTVVELIAAEPEDGAIALEVVSATSKIKAQIKDELPTFKVDINVVAHIVDLPSPSLDLNKQAVIDNLNRRLATTVKLEIEEAIRQAQLLASDVFGFGAEFNRTYPKLWLTIKDDWNEIIFPKVDVDVFVEASINLTGFMREPLQERYLETK